MGLMRDSDVAPVEPLGTAARHASSRVPVAAPHDTVDAVLAAMRGQDYDSAAVVAVCRAGVLVGLATIERLLAAPGDRTVGSVMDPDPPRVAPGTDQERAAWKAVQHGEPGLAVVDGQGRFRGLIPPQQLLGVLLEEHDEDLARIGGFLHTTAGARTASEESVARRLWHRMPWLAVGLAGALLSAALVAGFEDQLADNIAIAYFIPGIVYLADAVGTQTETVAIRGLSVGVGIGRIAAREALTGLLVGLLLAAVLLPVVILVWGEPALAAAVAVAVLAASAIATLVAMALPWLLARLGFDPAFGSGPLATVVQDLLSILIYLLAVSLLLG
ncbi:magnesium transporter [Catellatospora sp. IY07-71]|nr:magnesium transporter [Catellatospora sp. IY07-71]